MKKTPPHNFHVRLPDELFADIVQGMRRKGGKSLNREIVERLGETRATDAASRIADALRPLLGTLEETEAERVAKLLIEAAEILANRKKRGRSTKP